MLKFEISRTDMSELESFAALPNKLPVPFNEAINVQVWHFHVPGSLSSRARQRLPIPICTENIGMHNIPGGGRPGAPVPFGFVFFFVDTGRDT